MRRIGIVAKRGLNAAAEHLAQLDAWLSERGVDALYESDTALLSPVTAGRVRLSREELAGTADLVVVLGGDGTLISMAARIAQARRDVPLLGVNFGSLGFLTEIRIDEIYASLQAVLDGRAVYEHRAMLQAEAFRNDQRFDTRVLLNDVVFTKGALSRMIELSVWVDGGFVTRVKADGLIVASATGSTAYNLAAGGPIVHPSANALILTPIAPHTLTNRPVVIPGSAVVDVRPHVNDGDDVFVTYDGQSGYPIRQGDMVRTVTADERICLVKAPSRGYFELLREKLKWGER